MSREFMFENEHAICWKTTVPPNLPLKMHRHDRARTIVALQGGVLKRVDEDGSRMDLVFKTGKAYWYEADPRITCTQTSASATRTWCPRD